jgi:hypothetical protein
MVQRRLRIRTFTLSQTLRAHTSICCRSCLLRIVEKDLRVAERFRIDGKQGVVHVSRSIIESGSGFQRVVSRHINEPVLYLVTNADGVLETAIRARAIENVVPIAIPESDGYRIFNPTRYRQVSSYFDRGVAVVDEQRQAAGSVFKRIPETAYRKLLA